jgi:hypothetical protein
MTGVDWLGTEGKTDMRKAAPTDAFEHKDTRGDGFLGEKKFAQQATSGSMGWLSA